MTITPLLPRTPYMAVLTASLRTSMDATSCGLSQLSVPFGPGVIGTPSTTNRGSLLSEKDDWPRICIEMPPPGARVTRTPATRPAISCSSGTVGCRAISSAVTVEGEGGGGAGFAAPWAQPRMATMPTGDRTRAEYQIMGPPFVTM